jgi:hypothetical protein
MFRPDRQVPGGILLDPQTVSRLLSFVRQKTRTLFALTEMIPSVNRFFVAIGLKKLQEEKPNGNKENLSKRTP